LSQNEHVTFLCVNRLDRLASGILIFGRSKKTLTKFQTQLKNHSILKNYIARVKASFESSQAEIVVQDLMSL